MEGVTAGCLAACAIWYAQIDNDVAFHTDRWYTSGVRVARAHKLAEGKYAEFGILHEAYTPDPERPSKGIWAIRVKMAAECSTEGSSTDRPPGQPNGAKRPLGTTRATR